MEETARKPEADEIEGEVKSTIEDLSGSSLSYIERMEEFKEKNDLLKIDYLYLYKFEDKITDKREFLDKLDSDFPPDEDEIGTKHGGGRYLVRLVQKKSSRFPGGTTRVYKLKIHQRYDEIKKVRDYQEGLTRRSEAEANKNQSQQPQLTQQPQRNNADVLEIAERILLLATPFLTPLLKRQESSGTGNNTMALMSEVMKESYMAMGTMMRESIAENYRMISDLQKKNFENVEKTYKRNNETSTKEEGAGLSGLVEQFLPLLPKILGNDVQSKFLQKLVKSSDEMKQLKNDHEQLESLISYIVQKEGVETTSRLLDALGIEYAYDEGGIQESENTEEFPADTDELPIDPEFTAGPELTADPELPAGPELPADPELTTGQNGKRAIKKTVSKRGHK